MFINLLSPIYKMEYRSPVTTAVVNVLILNIFRIFTKINYNLAKNRV